MGVTQETEEITTRLHSTDIESGAERTHSMTLPRHSKALGNSAGFWSPRPLWKHELARPPSFRAPLFVAQGIDRIEVGGFDRRVGAKNDADDRADHKAKHGPVDRDGRRQFEEERRRVAA